MKLAFLFLISFLPNFVKLALYRVLFSAEIGPHTTLGFGTVICAKKLRIGHHTRIGHFTFILAQNVEIGSYAKFGHLTVIRVHSFFAANRAIISSSAKIFGNTSSPESIFTMGMHSWVFPYCFIDVTRQVTLGKNVGVGGGSYIFTHGYWLPSTEGFPVAYKSVSIADDVWIPWDCFIMPGASIGSKVIVGARSLVSGVVPDNALVAGTPAKLIREKCYRDVSAEDKIAKISQLISDFFAKNNCSFETADTGNKITFSVKNEPDFVVHKAGKECGQGFNIALEPLDNAAYEHHLCYSLADYKASSYEKFPKIVKDWFEYIRCEGLRLYPIDEI